MKIILLSGGSGKRLWPLSNDVRSKQFLKLLQSPDGTLESMIQRVVRQIRESGISDSIIIATGDSQLDSIQSQLGSSVDVVTEPSRRDTFPAIALATMYLKSQHVSMDEPIVVMPCDVFTEAGYFDTLSEMGKKVEADTANLVLMGIQPTSPSSKFGYIVPDSKESGELGALKVKEFIEKPDTAHAESLIDQCAKWNGGVFAFRLGYLIDIVEKYTNGMSYDELKDNFSILPKVSFDYEVVEKEESIAMVPFNGKWKDLGTWDALSEELPDKSLGYVIDSKDINNTHVVNELDIPIVCAGVENLIISASPDGILIADKNSSESIKQYVSVINSRPMFEERRWGYYKVIGYSEYPDGYKYLTKLLHLNKDCFISYQVHAHRDEIWTFVDGDALLVVDGEIKKVGRGHVAHIKAGQRHAVKALGNVEIIEVQIGRELVETDIVRFDWNWECFF